MIVLGFDGLDARLVRDGIRLGELPNRASLFAPRDEAGAPALRPTIPPESPVSWAAMATGTGPDLTGIYGFVRRDPATYRLHNGLVDVRRGRFLTERIPLTRTKLRNRRRGASFWEIAAEQGIATVALATPVSFPPRRVPNLRELPGLGVGDILGTPSPSWLHSCASSPGPTRMLRCFRDLISWLLLLGGLSASLTVTWWLLRPDVFTVVRHDAPTFRRVNDHVVPETRFHRGDTMLILREWCIARLTDYIHERRFIDGLVYTLPVTSRISNAPGCYRRYVGVDVQEQLPPGAYRYEATLTYEVSPLRRQVVALPVAEITVIP